MASQESVACIATVSSCLSKCCSSSMTNMAIGWVSQDTTVHNFQKRNTCGFNKNCMFSCVHTPRTTNFTTAITCMHHSDLEVRGRKQKRSRKSQNAQSTSYPFIMLLKMIKDLYKLEHEQLLYVWVADKPGCSQNEEGGRHSYSASFIWLGHAS